MADLCVFVCVSVYEYKRVYMRAWLCHVRASVHACMRYLCVCVCVRASVLNIRMLARVQARTLCTLFCARTYAHARAHASAPTTQHTQH